MTEADVVGPAYHGHSDAEDFRPAPPLDRTVVRELAAGDPGYAGAQEELRVTHLAEIASEPPAAYPDAFVLRATNT